MATKTIRQKIFRQRLFLFLLLLLVLTSVLLFFFLPLLGKRRIPAGVTGSQTGLNSRLPDAHFKNEKEKSKLSLYEEAGKDSAKWKAAVKNDPYWQEEGRLQAFPNEALPWNNFLQSGAARRTTEPPGLYSGPDSRDNDPNARKIMDKLSQLKAVMNSNAGTKQTGPSGPADLPGTSPEIPPDYEMRTGQEQKEAHPDDPELKQLNGMLDKLILVQHPEKMQDSLLSIAEKNRAGAYPVTAVPGDAVITSMASRNPGQKDDTAFFDLEAHAAVPVPPNVIEALIPETQTLVTGATVKMRLLTEVLIKGNRIPRNALVYGKASLSSDRLKIAIASIRYQRNILPVSLEVYDADGMAGIFIPGSINRDVSKQSADDAIGSIGLTAIDPSLGAQAANAGLQAARTLMSKKIRLLRFTLKEGYRIFLKDSHQP